jgi:hypothetical protein
VLCLQFDEQKIVRDHHRHHLATIGLLHSTHSTRSLALLWFCLR